MEKDQDHFEILRTLEKEPESTQRELASKLGFSLGKLNYCLKALKQLFCLGNLGFSNINIPFIFYK